MNDRLSLPTLLSWALVAFTIEFDNEAEHQLPHRTTNHGWTAGSLHGPWLVSLVMWFNCMRFVDDKEVTIRELEQLARTKTNLNGMERWGYVVIEPDPKDGRPKAPRSAWLIRATRAGRKAQEIWRPLLAVIEGRWLERFGKSEIEQLRKSLGAIISQLDLELPDCLPVLSYGLFSKGQVNERRNPNGGGHDDASSLPLSSMLSKVLLAYAIEFEGESEVSLAISANVLRVVGEQGAGVRDLPRLAAVSKEAIAMALRFLTKHGYAVVQPESAGGRVKLIVLTPKGRDARDRYPQLVRAIEERWQARFGKETISALRASLDGLDGYAIAREAPIFRGLEPYPDGWRASIPRPEGLPHYPMILHRGGFPDGS